MSPILRSVVFFIRIVAGGSHESKRTLVLLEVVLHGILSLLLLTDDGLDGLVVELVLHDQLSQISNRVILGDVDEMFRNVFRVQERGEVTATVLRARVVNHI